MPGLQSFSSPLYSFFFFFFQAEDGIRDTSVTGVSDVCSSDLAEPHGLQRGGVRGPRLGTGGAGAAGRRDRPRSEERRVGKEWRFRWWPYHYKKKDEKENVELRGLARELESNVDSV